VREGWIQRRDVVDRFQNAAEAYGYLAIHGPDVVQATLAAGLKNADSLDAACRRDDEKLHEQNKRTPDARRRRRMGPTPRPRARACRVSVI
jgi:hypothetical protein